MCGAQRDRVLQTFYDGHRDSVKLVCALSGAVKGAPDTYAVRLVPADDVPGKAAFQKASRSAE